VSTHLGWHGAHSRGGRDAGRLAHGARARIVQPALVANDVVRAAVRHVQVEHPDHVQLRAPVGRERGARLQTRPANQLVARSARQPHTAGAQAVQAITCRRQISGRGGWA